MDNLKLLDILIEYSHDTACPTLDVLTGWCSIGARRKWRRTPTSRPVDRTNPHRRRWPRASASAHDEMVDWCFLPLALISFRTWPCIALPVRDSIAILGVSTSLSRESRAQLFIQNRTSRVDILLYCKCNHALNTLFTNHVCDRGTGVGCRKMKVHPIVMRESLTSQPHVTPHSSCSSLTED